MVSKQRRSAEINDLMAAPGFWDNPPKAQEVVSEMRRLTLEIKPLKELQTASDDLQVLLEFAAEDDSSASVDQAEQREFRDERTPETRQAKQESPRAAAVTELANAQH